MEDKIPDRELGSVLVEIKGADLPLVFSFAGLGDAFELRKTLADFPVNAIYLRDLKHNWYLNGMPGAGEDVDGVYSFLKKMVETHQPSKVFTLGASAGGFAALLYGSLLKADHILAFSPQTFMDKFHRFIYYDHRWKDREMQIYAGNPSNRVYLDVKPYVKKYQGSVSLFYDKKHRLDFLHGRRIRKSKKVTHYNNDEGGHNLITRLRDSGKLKLYLREIMNEKEPTP
jgi:hypothetical protein